VTGIVIFLILLVGCGKRDRLVGAWKLYDQDAGSFAFNAFIIEWIKDFDGQRQLILKAQTWAGGFDRGGIIVVQGEELLYPYRGEHVRLKIAKLTRSELVLELHGSKAYYKRIDEDKLRHEAQENFERDEEYRRRLMRKFYDR
jgi:hypothetical protein